MFRIKVGLDLDSDSRKLKGVLPAPPIPICWPLRSSPTPFMLLLKYPCGGEWIDSHWRLFLIYHKVTYQNSFSLFWELIILCPKDITWTQQRPELTMVSLTWHVSLYKVHKLHYRYTLRMTINSITGTPSEWPFWECTFGGVYVPCNCFYSHARWELLLL